MAATTVITCRGTVFSTTAQSSYTTTQTAYTPAADSLLVAFVANSLAATPLDPTTFTGHGVTWTKLTLGTRLLSTTHCLSVWVALAGKSPSSTKVVADYGGINQTGGSIIEYEITGADVSGTAAQAIQQNPTGTSATGTTGTVTYSAAAKAQNVELSCFLHLATEATTPRANWVEDATIVSDGNFNTPATGLEAQYRNDGTFETTSTATWTTSINWLAVGLEIVAALVPVNLRNRTINLDNPRPKLTAGMTALTLGLTLLQSTLAPAPFSQTDWPRPLGKASLEISTETRPPTDGVTAFSQRDWPNPQGKPFNLLGRTWTLNLQESTLVPSAAPAPFAQADWPKPQGKASLEISTETRPPTDGVAAFSQRDWLNPQGKPFNLLGRTWTINLQESTLTGATAASPFAQTEWPAPIRDLRTVRSVTEPTKLLLLGKDQVFGAPGQTQTYDWPNPKPRDYSVGLRTVIGTRQPYHVDLTPANLTDWPNPRPVPALSTLRPFTDQPRLLLVDTLFGAPGQVPDYDWPNPVARPSLRSLQTWTLGLQQSTLPLVAAAPFSLQDWPLTVAVVRSVDLRTHVVNLQQGTLSTIVAPFTPGDWPNPRGRDFPVVLRTSTDGRKAYHVDLTPAHLTEWPNPRGIVPSLELRTAVNNLLEYTLGQGTPFGLTEWPLPIGKAFPIALRTSLEWRDLVLVDPLPTGRLTEWPTPLSAGRSVDLRTALGNLLEYTLAQATPFTQGDWQNPTGKAHPITLRTWLDWRNRVLVEPLPSGRQTDWPTPLVAGRVLDLRTWRHNGQSGPLTPDINPFGLTDWVNPRGIYVPLQLRTHVAWRALNLVDPIPTGRLQDWPNPRGPKAAEDLRTWLQNLQEGTLAPEPVPFVRTDWPNPTGKGYPISLRTLAQWRQLGLLDLVPAHLTDWPNPQAKGNPHFLRAFVVVRQESGTRAEIDPSAIVLVASDGTIYIAADPHTVAVGGSPNVTVRTEIARVDVRPESDIDPEMN